MQEVSIQHGIWIILLIVAVFIYKKLKPDPDGDFNRGYTMAMDTLLGHHDADIRKRLEISETVTLSKSSRVDYLETKVDESRAFGYYDAFDRGVIAAIRNPSC